MRWQRVHQLVRDDAADNAALRKRLIQIAHPARRGLGSAERTQFFGEAGLACSAQWRLRWGAVGEGVAQRGRPLRRARKRIAPDLARQEAASRARLNHI